jgi:thiol:disulfide interchange protein DsbD
MTPGPLRLFAAVAVALLLAGESASAQIDFGRRGGQSAPRSADRLVKVRAVSDVDTVGPGQTFHVAVLFEIEPKWHIYWLNAGDSGTPTEVTVEAPPGWTAGSTLYPRPRRFKEPEGITYGYAGRTVLYVPVTAPKVLEAGRATFEVDVFFLVCKDVCLMGSVQKTVQVRTGAPGPDAAGPVVAKYRKRLPKPLAKVKGAAMQVEDGRLVITGPAEGSKSVVAFPDWVPGVVLSEATTAAVGDDRYRIEMPLRTEPQNAEGPLVARGVVALGGDDDARCYHFEVPLDDDGTVREDVP